MAYRSCLGHATEVNLKIIRTILVPTKEIFYLRD